MGNRMKKSTVKRKVGLLAMLFAVLVILGAGAVQVSAASTVAKIGSKNYSSLQKAFDAVKDGETIVLQKDVSSSKTITVNRSGKSFTLNLNKHTLTFKKSAYLYVKKGTLTLRNGTVKNTTAAIIKVASAGTLKITSGTYRGQITNKGTMSIQKGTFKITDTTYDALGESSVYSAPMITNTGTLTVKGGTFTVTGGNILTNSGTAKITGGTFSNGETMSYLIWNETSKGKLTVTGGTFTAVASVLTNDGGTVKLSGASFTSGIYGIIWNQGGGTMTISSGTYKYSLDYPEYGAIINSGSGSKLTIKGGKFTANYELLRSLDGATLKVTGGSFTLKKNGVMLNVDETSKITLSGGTFTGKKGYLYTPEGKAYVTVKSGATITVKKKSGYMMS